MLKSFVFIVLTVVMVVFVIVCSMKDEESRISPSHCFMWGPGLDNFPLPVRYFFIQAVDTLGDNFTESAGENAFSVNLYTASGSHVRAYVQVLDRHDGSYIVRFKLFDSLQDIMVNVLHKGRHVAGSPLKLSGPVYTEKCYCPVRNTKRWMDMVGCPKNIQQIDKDLGKFSDKINMKVVAKQAVERYNQQGRHSLCHYVVKNNKVYRKTYGQHVGFKMFMDAMLLSLTRKVVLPDFEFIVNLGDWPLEDGRSGKPPIPIFSWCGSENALDIVMPTYDVTESTLETMGRVSLDLLAVQANTGPPWENKSSLAFWRGRDSRQERLDLVKLSRQNPDLLDAKLTNMFFFQHNPSEHGEIVKHISFYDFFKHKYQVSLDGTVAAYRLPYLLASDAVVLKQNSDYYEHFYHDLEPYTHYIPINRDLSDLFTKLQWAKDNDDKAKQIGLNAQKYVRENLMARDIFCYHTILFNNYAMKLTGTVEVEAGMEEVAQPDDHEANCDCHRDTSKMSRRRKEEL